MFRYPDHNTIYIVSVKNFLILTLICVFTCGCAGFNRTNLKASDVSGTKSVSFLDVPFVKQKKSYCGPAALSSVFAYWGYDCKQEKIAADIYRQELHGVLNIDLEDFSRRKGFWAQGYVSDFDDIKEKIKHGMPVIAMERLHPYAVKRLHYVVLAGLDEKRGVIFEHDGKKSFIPRSFRGFLRNWQKAGCWMMVVVPPEKVYWTLEPLREAELGILLEQKGMLDAALMRYENSLKNKPDNHIILFNAGNIYLKKSLWDKAQEKYLQALKIKGDFADCFNNLACVFLKKNDYARAHLYADKAIAQDAKKVFYCLDTKAQIFLVQGDFEKACLFFEKADAQGAGIDPNIRAGFYKNWEENFRKTGNIPQADYAHKKLLILQGVEPEYPAERK